MNNKANHHPLFSDNITNTKRSEFEQAFDVMMVIKEGYNKPTPIMYRSAIAWKPFKRILGTLMGMELVHEYVEHNGEVSRLRYRLTEKGVLATFYMGKVAELMV